VEVFTEVVDTVIGQKVVKVVPAELGLDQSTRVHGLHGLDDLKVRNINVGVLWSIEVLLGDKAALLEKVFVYGLAVLLRDEHLFWADS
jgi:hypothetical protein